MVSLPKLSLPHLSLPKKRHIYAFFILMVFWEVMAQAIKSAYKSFIETHTPDSIKTISFIFGILFPSENKKNSYKVGYMFSDFISDIWMPATLSFISVYIANRVSPQLFNPDLAATPLQATQMEAAPATQMEAAPATQMEAAPATQMEAAPLQVPQVEITPAPTTV